MSSRIYKLKNILLLIPASMVLAAVTTNAQTNSVLRGELLKMLEADQQAREQCLQRTGDEQIKCFAEVSEKIDPPNAQRLAEIFNQNGFPTAETVGKDGVGAFLVILQHAPGDELRRKCLKPVKKAFQRKEISPTDYANYVDRLLVHQNKPQIYGSQFEFKGNKLVMNKVKDRKNLDRRRRKIGLSPMAEDAAILKDLYKIEVVIPD